MIQFLATFNSYVSKNSNHDIHWLNGNVKEQHKCWFKNKMLITHDMFIFIHEVHIDSCR